MVLAAVAVRLCELKRVAPGKARLFGVLKCDGAADGVFRKGTNSPFK